MIIGRAIPASPNILPDISDAVKITAITAKQIPNTLKANFHKKKPVLNGLFYLIIY